MGDILTIFGSEKLKRHGPTPCEYGTCPKGHYDNQITLLPCNYLALQHYEECEATGNFPIDDIVAKNARIIKEALKTIEIIQRAKLGVI